MPKKPEPPLKRIISKLDMSGECWLFMGSTNGRGYGVTSESPAPNVRKNHYVHRLMYEIKVGPIPKGMEVCHRCDVRRCCRPEHLFLATHQQNVTDSVDKNRHMHGEGHIWARLDEAAVRDIRCRYVSGESCVKLAREYGVAHATAHRAAIGRTWKHVV